MTQTESSKASFNPRADGGTKAFVSLYFRARHSCAFGSTCRCLKVSLRASVYFLFQGVCDPRHLAAPYTYYTSSHTHTHTLSCLPHPIGRLSVHRPTFLPVGRGKRRPHQVCIYTVTQIRCLRGQEARLPVQTGPNATQNGRDRRFCHFSAPLHNSLL